MDARGGTGGSLVGVDIIEEINRLREERKVVAAFGLETQHGLEEVGLRGACSPRHPHASFRLHPLAARSALGNAAP